MGCDWILWIGKSMKSWERSAVGGRCNCWGQILHPPGGLSLSERAVGSAMPKSFVSWIELGHEMIHSLGIQQGETESMCVPCWRAHSYTVWNFIIRVLNLRYSVGTLQTCLLFKSFNCYMNLSPFKLVFGEWCLWCSGLTFVAILAAYITSKTLEDKLVALAFRVFLFQWFCLSVSLSLSLFFQKGLKNNDRSPLSFFIRGDELGFCFMSHWRCHIWHLDGSVLKAQLCAVSRRLLGVFQWVCSRGETHEHTQLLRGTNSYC